MTADEDHHVVVLTPPGAGAIGVVRLVGPQSISIVNQVFRPAFGGGLSASDGDRLRYGRFVDGDETLDDVIVSPTSIHGRPAVDVCAHGGVRIIERILQTLERLGATVCEPAEAVELAWPTGSLIEHEVLEALSRAKTERAVRFLAWQHEHLERELEVIASLCRLDPGRAHKRLASVAQGYPTARTLIEGATVALVGPPNSGKSTLFNRLIGRPATVVSPQPGTTRDWVAEPVEMDGVPVTLVDTAGRADTADPLERQAAEAGRRVVEQAEVRVLLLDGSLPLSRAGLELRAEANAWSGCLMVMNKADAGSAWRSWNLAVPFGDARGEPIAISAATGAGCDDVVAGILAMLGYRGWVERVPCLFTRRQADAAASVASILPHDGTTAGRRLRQCLIGRCDEVTAAEGRL